MSIHLSVDAYVSCVCTYMRICVHVVSVFEGTHLCVYMCVGVHMCMCVHMVISVRVRMNISV